MAQLDVGELREIGSVCLSRSVRVTANLLTRTYNAYLAPAGIEVTQFSILCTIARGEAASTSELAERIGVERSTLARNLARLSSAGLVVAHAGSGRRVVHGLTDEGRERIAAALPLWRHAQQAIEEGMTVQGARQIRADLQALRATARAVEKRRGRPAVPAGTDAQT